jgi:hypothetical protein
MPPAKRLSPEGENLVRALAADLERDRPTSKVADVLNTPVSGSIGGVLASHRLLSVLLGALGGVFNG